MMTHFPHIPTAIADKLAADKARWDYRLLRPPLLIGYFVLRCLIFPLKYLIHRRPWGHENACIDRLLAFGLKYLASRDAVELIIRHVQIEPLLYRHLLAGHPQAPEAKTPQPLNGIDADFSLDSLSDMVRHNLTVAHDELSYELMERFDKERFLQTLPELRAKLPEDIAQYSQKILEINRTHSREIIGISTVVIFIVYTITIFGDLKTTVQALNSFGSDSITLWALKHLYANDPETLVDLDFYLQEETNRSPHNSSVFTSDPSFYLYYHIVFDEYAYERLRSRPPQA